MKTFSIVIFILIFHNSVLNLYFDDNYIQFYYLAQEKKFYTAYQLDLIELVISL